MLKHHYRRDDRDGLRWNMATDYAINPLVLADGFKLPSFALNDAKYADMSAERIYSVIPDEEVEKQRKAGGGGVGDVLDAPGMGKMSAAEKAAAEEAVDRDTVRAAIAGKMAGKLPGHLGKLIKSTTESPIRWKDRIREVMGSTNPVDYSWSRPNRVLLASMGVYAPGVRKESTGTFVIATDTSGSVWGCIEEFLSVINGFIEECKPERIILLQCDTQIVHREDVTDQQPLEGMKVHGGGGTEFAPVFDWVEEEGIRPDALVYLTDLYGRVPQAAPDYPVYWVCTSSETAPWGETIPLRK